MIEFTNRHFRIWGYTVSHSGLLLRSEQKYHDVANYDESKGFNIDIEFNGVSYINLPSDLYGLTLRQVISEVPQSLLSFVKFERKVFEISSNKAIYYVVAHSYLVGKNNWLTEDRLTNFGLHHDEILATSDN